MSRRLEEDEDSKAAIWGLRRGKFCEIAAKEIVLDCSQSFLMVVDEFEECVFPVG